MLGAQPARGGGCARRRPVEPLRRATCRGRDPPWRWGDAICLGVLAVVPDRRPRGATGGPIRRIKPRACHRPCGRSRVLRAQAVCGWSVCGCVPADRCDRL